MKLYSTREAAKKLGVPHTTLATYIAVGKVPGPKAVITGRTTTQIWTEEEIDHVRQLLPKIANGRKTRYKKKQSAGKKRSAVSKRQSAKPKKKKTKRKQRSG